MHTYLSFLGADLPPLLAHVPLFMYGSISRRLVCHSELNTMTFYLIVEGGLLCSYAYPVCENTTILSRGLSVNHDASRKNGIEIPYMLW